MINVRDAASVNAARPFLVAHRGGVVQEDAPENSLRAIQLAAERGYAMVEVDVMEARDGEPVLIHDGLYINCGVKERVSNLTSQEIAAIRYRASDQHVIAFAQAVETCASLGLGLMLDKLQRDAPGDNAMSAGCLHRIESLIRDAGLASSTVAIYDTPWLREHLAEVALFPVRKEECARLLAGDPIDLRGQFWFGWAAELSDDAVARLHNAGTFAIVSINTFHYPHHAPFTLAWADIDRLLAAGCDGFQIDSVYGDRFRP